MTEKVHYEEMRPGEFVERLNAFPVAYLPLGTLEWHGRHMPLGADGIQPRDVFEKLAKKLGGVVFPMLFVGPDVKAERDGQTYFGMEYHSFENGQYQRLFGNCYYMEQSQFDALLHTIVKNMARVGFKAVIAHGHGPSTTSFRALRSVFEEQYGMMAYTLWDIGYDGKDGIQTDHAAANETSLVMSAAPELVDLSEIQDTEPLEGIWGHDPRRFASREYGNQLIDRNVEKVSAALEQLLPTLQHSEQTIQYHDVKNLLDLHWEP